LADRAARRLEHLEEAFVHGLCLCILRPTGDDVPKVLRGSENIRPLPSGHRRRGTETHRATVAITERYRPLDNGT
jgi:hypothetical protein